MSRSRDRRLIEQSGNALRRVSDWLRDLDTVVVDGQALDALGEVIFAVDEAADELEVTPAVDDPAAWLAALDRLRPASED